MSQQTDCNSVTFSLDDLVVNTDDLLPPLVKLEKYSTSDAVLHRQIAARDIVETFCSTLANDKELDCIFRVFSVLSEDYEPCVRMELMDHVPHVALLCRENSAKAEHFIFQHLLPVTMKYLTDINNQVRRSGHSSLLFMIEQGLVDKASLEEKLLPLVLQLTESSHIDDYRTEAVSLLSKISSLVGREVTERMLLTPFISLCQEGSFHVRKVCAESFGEICTVMGCETTENILLPKFSLLCGDSVWGIRKACAEVFTPVSCVCSMEVRHKKLSRMFLNLLCDESRWVRMSAFQSLGPFISTFAKPGKTGIYCDKDGLLTVLDTPNGVHNSAKIGFQSSCEIIKSICGNEFEMKNEKSAHSCTAEVSANMCDETPESLSNIEEPLADPDPVIGLGKEEAVCETLCTEEMNDDDSCVTESDNYLTNHVSNSQELSSKCQSEQICPSEDVDIALTSLPDGDAVNMKLNGHSDDDDDGGEDELEPQSCDNVCRSVFCNHIDAEAPKNFCSEDCEISGDVPGICELVNGHDVASERNGTCTDQLLQDGSVWEDMSPIQCDNCESSILAHQDKEDVSCDSECQLVCIEDVDDLPETCAFNSFLYWKLPVPEVEPEDLENIASPLESICDVPISQRNSVCNNSLSADSSDGVHSSIESTRTNVPDMEFGLSQHKSLNQTKNGIDDPKKLVGDRILDALKNCDFIDTVSLQACLRHMFSPLDQDIVPPELLLLYLSMTSFTKPPRVDAEMARHCAYSLPAVALTLGRKFWPCLKDTYHTLASDMQGFIMQWKVRRTLASSMHKLAVILGPDIAAKDLLPIFSGFIRDLDEVRIGILQHLSEFLEVLRPKERKEYLPRLSEFLNTDNDRNWRFRHCLAQQLIPMAQLYEPVEVRRHLIPLAISLLQDRVAEVRMAAVRVVAVMVKRMSQADSFSLTKEFLTELEQFLNSRKWLHRQTYVYLCQEFIKENSLPHDQFAENIMPQLLYLCWDQVANVRLAVARCLALVIWPLAEYSDHSSPHRELLLHAIHALQEDIDSDVKHFANIVATDECSCLLHGESKVEEVSIP